MYWVEGEQSVARQIAWTDWLVPTPEGGNFEPRGVKAHENLLISI